jgi:hypothetical protein
MTAARPEERPIATLVAELARLFGLLIRQEAALLKAEMVEHFSRLGTRSGMVIGGVLLAFAGLLYLMAAATLALAMVVQPWLAALIVAAVALTLGIALFCVGRLAFRPAHLAPERTFRSLKENVEWFRGRVR